MPTIFNPLTPLMLLPGLIGALVVDAETGSIIEQTGVIPLDLAVLAMDNTQLLRTQMRMVNIMGVSEPIGDILIQLETQMHLLRPLHGKNTAGLFIYAAMESSHANLDRTRREIDAVAVRFA